jgi:LacI family transcriptional regulator
MKRADVPPVYLLGYVAATIKEIALKLNVSCASVSRALNDMPGVGEKTRRKIIKTAREVGYVPDAHAKALVSGKVPFLGLVVPDITNPFFPALARAAEEEAFAAGYSLLLLNTNWVAQRLRQAMDLLASRRVSGLMFSESIDAIAADLNLSATASSIVFTGVDAPEGSGLCAVRVDDVEGGRQVGRHLIDCGARSVAFVGGPIGSRSTEKRFAGFSGVLEGSELACRVTSATSGPWTEDSGYARADELLKNGLPDAVFAANDLLALGMAKLFAERGIVVGKDVALVGYDNIDIVSRTAVPITSVDQPAAEVGLNAVRCLLSQLESRNVAQGLSLLPSLVVRQSTLGYSNSHKRSHL